MTTLIYEYLLKSVLKHLFVLFRRFLLLLLCARRYCSEAFSQLKVTVERSKSGQIMTHARFITLPSFTAATPQLLIFCTEGDWIGGSI